MTFKEIRALLFCALLVLPFPAQALFDIGGWVTNVPGIPGSYMSAGTMPYFPIYGRNGYIYPGMGSACLNGLDEVNQIPAKGESQPTIYLQLKGKYSFAKGPATHPGQQILGKYLPVPMVCMANFVIWVVCGPGNLCPVIFPLPYYAAPLMIFNGSSM